MTRKTLLMLGCVVLTSSSAAFAAEEEDEGELVEKIVVRNRLFSVANRFELGVNAGFGLLSRMTDTYVLNASVAYNILEWLALEVRGGWALGGLTSVARAIQDDYSASGTASDASDAWQMTGHGVLGLRFQPIYGKLNLFGEGSLHFQFYLWVGGGVTGLRKESLVACAGGSSSCTQWLAGGRQGASPFTFDGDTSGTFNKISPLGSLALGFRFLFGREADHSFKLEARSWSFLDSYLVGITKNQVSEANPTGGGTEAPGVGLTNVMTIDLGYAFIF